MTPRAVNTGVAAREAEAPMQQEEYPVRSLAEDIAAASDRRFPSNIPVVYFVQAGDAGPIKIGYCFKFSAVLARMLSIQTGCPWPLTVRRVMEAHKKRMDETELHNHFAKHRLSGEWFEPVPELVELARANVGSDPIARVTAAAYARGFADGHLAGGEETSQTLANDIRDLAKRYDTNRLADEIADNVAGMRWFRPVDRAA